jgi:hypothetical protein
VASVSTHYLHPPVAYIFLGLWCQLRPSGVMPRCLVLPIPCQIDAPVPHQLSYSATPIVSVIDMILSQIVPSNSSLWQPLLILVIRKGQCRKPFFSPLSYPAIHFLDEYGFFRTLDDDVVVTSVFRSTITKSVLASVSV